MKEPKLNMEIPLSYYDKNGQQEKNFTLSGWFHSYTGTGMGFVSEAYCKNAGYTFDLNRIQIAPLSNGKQGKGCYKGNAFGTALGYRWKLC